MGSTTMENAGGNQAENPPRASAGKRSGAPLDHPRRCQAHNQRGGPCRAWAARGQRVCLQHGGKAKQCLAAAQRRLDEAADRMAAKLLGFADDENMPPAVALAAVRDALDRVIGRAPTTLDVSVGPRPWEQIYDGLAGGSRAESRARRGVPDKPESQEPQWVIDALEAAQHTNTHADVIDAEVTDETPSRRYGPPPVTGLDAIAEANRANGFPMPPPRALPPARRRA